MPDFQLTSEYQPSGDQPAAIDALVRGIEEGKRYQTLLGATGTGKTFTMANVIQQTQRPTLVIAHNKTLAAQLCSEFREFFPHNAVEYFVSYYDYYQPEAYIARTDTYIEKDALINDEIDRLRHSATQAVLERRDVIIVSSVSCIYGLGSPDEYRKIICSFRRGGQYDREDVLHRLIDMQFTRNNLELQRGTFRVRGDILEVQPIDEEVIVRVEFFGDDCEKITLVNPLTGEVLGARDSVTIFPASHYVTSAERLERAIGYIQEEMKERVAYFTAHNQLIEAQRIEQRVRFDIEMMRELGYCSGIENYSRHLDQRVPGTPGSCLLDYFPKDYLTIIDESHQTLPQIRAMYNGDKARKDVLIEFGFRLPSAADNRPLKFDEWEARTGQTVFVSATPGPFEIEHGGVTAEQIIRPTGLIDPEIVIRPTKGQIDDLINEIRKRTTVLVNTGKAVDSVDSVDWIDTGDGAVRLPTASAPHPSPLPPGERGLAGEMEEGAGGSLDSSPSLSLSEASDLTDSSPSLIAGAAGSQSSPSLPRRGLGGGSAVDDEGGTASFAGGAAAGKAPRKKKSEPTYAYTVPLAANGAVSEDIATVPVYNAGPTEDVGITEDGRTRILVTTLTKRMAEDLSSYLEEIGIKVHYLHSELKNIDRLEILRDLRRGIYDVIVGINLLREGLDLPEVSLVAILDADKEGFLRSETSLVQTVGRAARNVDGQVIMYADKITGSMQRAIDETNRRRNVQLEYNREHGITPKTINKAIRDLIHAEHVSEEKANYRTGPALDMATKESLPLDQILEVIKTLEAQMREAAKALEFEQAASLRDEIGELRRLVPQSAMGGEPLPKKKPAKARRAR
jgi:excinuclease ABC subunit B